MQDEALVELLFAREERVLPEVQGKYGAYCLSIARGILCDEGESEECLNDTLLQLWRSVPPQRPRSLRAYIGRLTRNLAISRWRKNNALRRGGSQLPLALEELGECVDGGQTPDQALEKKTVVALLNRFVRSLPETERYIFLRRYWYLDSNQAIAGQLRTTPGRIASQLLRTRRKLRRALREEGILE